MVGCELVDMLEYICIGEKTVYWVDTVEYIGCRTRQYVGFVG